MKYNINNALENLEKNLQKVESAREQVENTVNAYHELQGKVEGFTNSLKSITLSVKEIISSVKEQHNTISSELSSTLSLIKESCNDINRLFSDSCSSAILSFGAKSANSVSQINTGVNSLKEQINNLHGIEKSFSLSMEQIGFLKTKIEDIARDLESSQSSQDIVLNDIYMKVGECNLVTLKITEELVSNHNLLKELVDSESIEIKKLIKDIEVNLQKLLLDSKNEIIQQNSNNANQVTKNQKLIYCVIILIVIDIVINFIQ